MGCGVSKASRVMSKETLHDSKMTVEEKVNEMFCKYDTDKDNKIDIDEFRKLCMDMGYFFKKDELATQVKVFDRTGDGRLDRSEIMTWYQSDERFKKSLVGPVVLRKVEKLAGMFRKHDRDSSGTIDSKEFDALFLELRKMGFEGKKEDYLKQVDTSGDGLISFNEFVQWFLKRTS